MSVKKLVFGPVPSRRLGFSLGVDLIPFKYCSFDCIYCQLGATRKTEVERRSFYEPDLLVKQVVERVKAGGRIDCVSLSGSGEPTLNKDIGSIIKGLKKEISLPVAVITNGSLLCRQEVREEIMAADIVLPSLDAPNEAIYRQVNRPHGSLSFDTLIEGLRLFCKEYKGRTWLEIMLIKHFNNDTEHIEILNEILNNMSVEKIHLNTVVRPPAEKAALALSDEALQSISRLLGPRCEVIAETNIKQVAGPRGPIWEESVLAMLGRRSLTLEDIAGSTGLSTSTARMRMKKLEAGQRVRSVLLGRRRFYLAAETGQSR
jgi:wyosine [tRNA(Phe)-imidazoG37] synthetase (radical SAM superfamily)